MPTTVKFQVRGTGEFPHDMLRYDNCRAASPEDQALIDLTYESDRAGEMFKPRTVTLLAAAPHRWWLPTAARWQSFTWRVWTNPVSPNIPFRSEHHAR
jgi:hypothetical protein